MAWLVIFYGVILNLPEFDFCNTEEEEVYPIKRIVSLLIRKRGTTNPLHAASLALILIRIFEYANLLQAFQLIWDALRAKVPDVLGFTVCRPQP